jgi:Plasmid replication region DNA-binding N-term
MQFEAVQDAVSQLLQEGHALATISGPMVRQQLGGRGSYRDICEHLKAIKQEAGVLVEEPSEDEEPGEVPDPDAAELPPPGASVVDLPTDPVVEAEQGLSEAQQALQTKMDALPEAERELADSRGRVLEALAAQLAAIEGCRRGIFANDDPVRTMTAAEVSDAVAHFQQARQQWRYALDGVEGYGARLREAQAQLQEARRQAFLQEHHPALVQALQDALEAQANDPWLSPQADPRALQAVQHTWQHRYAIEAAQKAIAEACRAGGL